jgi:DNA-binding MarR family transcriptional regulator
MAPITPDRPSLALLLRVIYQHHSQAIESALRTAGFDDIAPSAGNVFPFMRPEGITVSALAELAGVRKQTMAQAVEQLERGGYLERRENPEDRRSRLIFLTERGRTVTPVTHAAAAAVERRWAELIGTDELETIRQELGSLLEKIRVADRVDASSRSMSRRR